MNIDAIQMICDKLGTTVNQFVPEVIRYETRMNTVGLIIGAIILIIGVICIGLAFYLEKHSSDCIEVPFFIIGVLGLIGILGLVIGLLMVFIFVGELIALDTSPQIYAYKTIFVWIGGN